MSNVRRAITEALRLRGVDVLTAQKDNATRLPDPAASGMPHRFYRAVLE